MAFNMIIILRKITSQINQYAGTANARYLLYGLSALESLIIPIPIDPYLAVCVLSKSDRWVQISLLTALASVIGGAAGWYLGVAMQDFVSGIIQLLPPQIAGPERFDAVARAFDTLGLALILIGAFTPLPYKVIAISAGLFGYGLIPFLLISAVGRSARFLLVGAMVAYRRDFRLMLLLASLLLILVGIGLYLTG